MKKKYKIARAMNAWFCFWLVIAIMFLAHAEWSKYGEYGTFQFVSSVVFHGGLGVIIYFGIDWILRRVFNQINE